MSDLSQLPNWVTILVQAGRLAPSADNSQPWRFIRDGDTLQLTYDRERSKPGFDRSHPVILMGLGAVIENLVDAATACGIDTGAWEFRYRKSDTDPFLIVPPPPNSGFEKLDTAKYADRHTNRNPYSRKPLPDNIIDQLTQLSQGNVRVSFFSDRESIGTLSQLVRRASELRFQTEAVHRWMSDGLRFTPEEIERNEGLDVNTLALPPGGKAILKFVSDWDRMKILNRLYVYKLLALVEGMQFKNCGGAILLTGRGRDPSDWVEAGRLMERIWLFLSEQGFSLHPYFVLPDVFYRLEANLVSNDLKEKASGIANTTRDFLGSREEVPYLVMRAGKAKNPPVPSRRLPAEQILSAGKPDPHY